MSEPSLAASETRGALLLKLRIQGIRNTDVLRAIETIPREMFVPHQLADLAARDLPLPIACGQTMSEPSLVARMLEALDVGKGDRVLEIGTGSGYVTAILASLALHVVSIERFQTLATAARTRVEQLGLENVEIVCADGLAADLAGPYDRILVHLGLPEVPTHLTDHLGAGGALVCGRALADSGRTHLVRLVRNAHGDLEETDCGLCLLPRPIGGVAEAL